MIIEAEFKIIKTSDDDNGNTAVNDAKICNGDDLQILSI